MLSYEGSDTDAAAVKLWLSSALKNGAGSGLTKVGLADYCGVKKQAVDGWLRTGRITKSNLAKAGMYFNIAGPNFSGHPVIAAEPVPAFGWPFRLVHRDEIARLPKRRLARLDRLLRDQLNGWVEDDAADKRRSA